MKNFFLIFFLSTVFLFSQTTPLSAKNYYTKTKDYQFVIYSSDEKLAISTQEIAYQYPNLLKNMLNIYFKWDIPASIYIYSPIDWKPQSAYTIKNSKQVKQIDLCFTKNAETSSVFPAITALILSEIIKDEKGIKEIDNNERKIPIWLTEGLWRHAVKYNTPQKLTILNNLDLNVLTKTNPDKLTQLDKDLYFIEAAFLVDYLLYLPYGSITLRKIAASTYKKKPKKHAKIIYKAYNEHFENVDDFNKQWKEYLEAKILSSQIS